MKNQRKKQSKRKIILFSGCFCAIIFSGFFNMINNIYIQINEAIISKDAPVEFSLKTLLSETFVFEDILNNINGVIQKDILGKKEVNNFKYYKNFDNGYIVIGEKKSKKSIKTYQKNILAIYNKAIQKNADFIYISMPSRLNEEYEQQLTGIDYSNKDKDLLLSGINSEVPVFDLRDVKEIQELENNYYKTDHHWNTDSVFLSFKATIDKLNELYSLTLDPDNLYTDINNYETLIKNNSLSGSIRQNIKSAYLDKEDFKLYVPEYSTDFHYEHYIDNELDSEKSGDFKNALCDMEIFNNDAYLNKYNVFLGGGYVESRIYNNSSENNKKLLLISSSYGRAFAPYISQCFSEVIFLDPQVGRYNESVVEYIERYNPDVVLVLHDDYVIANVD